MKVKVEDILELIKETGVLVDVNTLKSDKILSDQGIDSLDIANIFLNIQEKYDVVIPIEKTQELNSIDKILDYIN
ncbi:acyl carrier protein [uncultured Campylobacter sp.]|uniref:acyl carrier protein n=1 Tax=uncultured Campylobacter sp. TaxID=218934 RepID=UPI002604CEC1|nr:acyl carrier protein [uncultured Campylobacter sp.]